MLTRLYLLYSERNIVNIMHIGLLALQLENSAKCVRLYYSPPLPHDHLPRPLRMIPN